MFMSWLSYMETMSRQLSLVCVNKSGYLKPKEDFYPNHNQAVFVPQPNKTLK